jgi:hypothetical protein
VGQRRHIASRRRVEAFAITFFLYMRKILLVFFTSFYFLSYFCFFSLPFGASFAVFAVFGTFCIFLFQSKFWGTPCSNRRSSSRAHISGCQTPSSTRGSPPPPFYITNLGGELRVKPGVCLPEMWALSTLPYASVLLRNERHLASCFRTIGSSIYSIV